MLSLQFATISFYEKEQIQYILVTHCHFDHTGGLAELKTLLDADVVAHSLDAPYIEAGDPVVTAASWYGADLTPVIVDQKLINSHQTMQLGDHRIDAYHMPGHSPGSVVYVTESDGMKVLFGQDIHGPLDAQLLSDRDAYQQSLEKMIALDADILCEGHFGIYRGKTEVKDFIQSYITNR